MRLHSRVTEVETLPRTFKSWYGADVYLSNTTWVETRNIVPTRCLATGKLLMPFTKAYKGTRRITNEGYEGGKHPTMKEYFWMLPEEFTFNKLKGII